MRSFHSRRAGGVLPPAASALLTIAIATSAAAQPQTPPRPTPDAATFTIFLRAVPIGTEQIALKYDSGGWTILSSGRIGAPLDIVARKVEVRYTQDWRPIELTIDATVHGEPQTIHTVVSNGTAKTAYTVNGKQSEKSDAIDPSSVLVVPTSFFAPYEAFAQRFRGAAAGAELPVYNAPISTLSARVVETSPQQIQTSARMIAARRTRIALAVAGVPIEADVWTDETGRMIRLSVPAQSLEVVREDIAAVSARSVPISRPNDEPIRIPSNGFTLAGTLSKPAQATGRLPAVVLVGGSGPTDRDGLTFGIPILGEIAGALADAGFIVVRYDKRGIGQSGGRAEAASLSDYAEDVRAAVKLLADRKDVDPKRIAVIGHSEGGSVAMMAAARDKRIAGVALLATPGVVGSELVLAQQQRLLEHSTLSAEEKQAKIATQKQIHDAVISGKGLERLPPDIRRAVDNAEFQSILTADPAKLMAEVRRPVLIVQGDLDTQVDPSNAEKLETLARQRKNAPPVEVKHVAGVNHLLVPATTGEVDEYSRLAGRHVSPAVTESLAAWLKKLP
jgi:pimeloyl-ACP methyl ester carboxylesterase